MYVPHYLTLSRHQVYYFRFPIPAILHPEGRPSHIRLSLETRCPKEALRLARGLAYLGDRLLSNPAVYNMDYHEIRSVLFEHFKELREQIKAKINRLGPLSKTDKLSFEKSHTEANEAFEAETYSLIATDKRLTEIIQQRSLSIEVTSPDYATFQREYVRHYRDYSASVLEYNSRLEQVNFKTDPASLAQQKQWQHEKRHTLGATLDKYEKTKKENGWNEKTYNSTVALLRVMREYWGDDRPLHVSTEESEELLELIRRIPKHYRSTPALKKLSIRQIVEVKGLKGMGILNINKHLLAFSSFYDWCIKRKYITENNFKILLEKPKAGVKTGREMFSQEQVDLILKTVMDETSPLVSRHYQRWGTLIAYCTGARLNEIAQLRLEDIITEEGVLCFSLTNEEDDQKLKTITSKRKVPVHSLLIEHGFLEYIEFAKKQLSGRLLFELTYDRNNGYGRNLGRWFNEALLVKLGIKKPELVFHSFRHTFTTRLERAGVDLSLIRRLIGHVSSDTLNKYYLKGPLMPQLKEVVEKL